MKGIVFIVAAVVGLIVFGIPMLGCLMMLFMIVLGVGVDTAMTLGMILTVAIIVGTGIKTFFVDE